MIKGLIKKRRPTRFERAYILLYNEKIRLSQFAEEAGIPDAEEAQKQLVSYRQRVIKGEIEDPRDTYNKWT